MNIGATVLNLKKILTILLIVFVSLAAAEMSCRSFWYFRFNIPFFRPDRILYSLYPELAIVDNEFPTRNDKYYDVLLLGGSVLHPDWAPIEQLLRWQLDKNGQGNVRIFNLAKPAHTSRDSLLKYAALDKARFDLVVFYHGANEARANNVPPARYRNDYGHYSWYESVNALSSYHSKAILALPYSLHYIYLRMSQIVNSGDYVPTHIPRQDWTRYGHQVRSATSFKQNIEDFIDIASRRGDRILLMTFAFYVPQNYSYKLFQQQSLDYASHSTPVETWGEPGNVIKTVKLHNEVIRDLVSVHKEVCFIDLNSLMPTSSRFFNDPCHLTLAGSAIFADNVIKVIRSSKDTQSCQ